MIDHGVAPPADQIARTVKITDVPTIVATVYSQIQARSVTRQR